MDSLSIHFQFAFNSLSIHLQFTFNSLSMQLNVYFILLGAKIAEIAKSDRFPPKDFVGRRGEQAGISRHRAGGRQHVGPKVPTCWAETRKVDFHA